MGTKEHIMQYREQYRAWLRERIKRKTKEFVERALPLYGPQRVYSKRTTPLTRNDKDVNVNSFWEYELWCQDESLCCWDEFLDETLGDQPQVDTMDDEEVQELLNGIFDEVFKSLAKELRLDPRVLTD